VFSQFTDDEFDAKTHATRIIQSHAISQQLAKLAEGVNLLDRELHSQVFFSVVSKHSSGWINCDNHVYITQPDTKALPNCDVLFSNGDLQQAYGHVTLTMSA